MMRRVCILTTVHHPFDTRVFHREAKTLLEAGYEVILIARHSSEEIVDGIHIVPLAQPSNRFERMTRMMFLALICISISGGGVVCFCSGVIYSLRKMVTTRNR